jgi:hypothetical protein
VRSDQKSLNDFQFALKKVGVKNARSREEPLDNMMRLESKDKIKVSDGF